MITGKLPRRYLLAPALLALLVAGCAAPVPQPAELTPALPLPGDSQPAESLPDALPSLPQPDAGLLLGLEPRQIQDILGTPSLVRREGAAQVMQFKNGNCIFDVIFYEEAAGGAFRARHLASRLTDGAPIIPQDCLARILPGGQYPAGIFPEQTVTENEPDLQVEPDGP